MISIPLSSKKVVEEHYTDIIDSLKKRILYVKRNGASINKKKYTPNVKHQRILEDLRDEKQLKPLITGSLDKLIDSIRSFKKIDSKVTSTKSTLNRLLYAIFINTEYTKLDKWRFINRLKLDTCAYCNRSYTYSLSKKDGIKPELDHFYPKSKYPFLGLSFYNLIPSCQTCNGFGGKEEKDPSLKNMVSPYLLEHDTFYFTYDVKSIDVLSPLEGKSSVEVILKAKKGSGNLSVFKLPDLYQKHEDHVLELIVKSKLKYTEEYRKYLRSFKDFSFSEGEVDRMIIGNYTSTDELHKRPLSKLYRDIGIELGLIKGGS